MYPSNVEELIVGWLKHHLPLRNPRVDGLAELEAGRRQRKLGSFRCQSVRSPTKACAKVYWGGIELNVEVINMNNEEDE